MGYAQQAVTISNAYASGTVKGTDANSYAGGLMGAAGSNTAINNAYATGSVTGTNYAGGLLGQRTGSGGNITASFWDTTETGRTNAIGDDVRSGAGLDVTGLTMAQLKNTAYFTALAGAKGWDFDTVWAPPGNGYRPELYALSKVIRVDAANDATAAYGASTATWVGGTPGATIYGAGLYAFGATAYGAPAAFAASPSLAISGLNVGAYDTVEVTGLAAAGSNRYRFIYTTALTVTKATLTITAAGKSKVYGAADPTLTYTPSGLVNGDTASVITGALTRDAGSDVGSYAIKQGTLSAGGNYLISYSDASLAITAATLTITAAGKSKVYGAADPTLTYTPSGLVNGDTASVITGGLTRDAGSDVGSYAIKQGTLSAGGNYAINFVGNDFAITKAALTITAAGTSKIYDATAWNGGNGVSYSGFVGGDTETVLGGMLAYGGTAQGAVNANTYTITASGLTSDNYDITYVDGALIIDKASLTVRAENASKTYDSAGWSGGNGVSYAGFVGGDTEAVLGGSLTYSGTAQGAVNAGSYIISVNGLSSDNYDITYVDGILTVANGSPDPDPGPGPGPDPDPDPDPGPGPGADPDPDPGPGPGPDPDPGPGPGPGPDPDPRPGPGPGPNPNPNPNPNLNPDPDPEANPTPQPGPGSGSGSGSGSTPLPRPGNNSGSASGSRPDSGSAQNQPGAGENEQGSSNTELPRAITHQDLIDQLLNSGAVPGTIAIGNRMAGSNTVVQIARNLTALPLGSAAQVTATFIRISAGSASSRRATVLLTENGQIVGSNSASGENGRPEARVSGADDTCKSADNSGNDDELKLAEPVDDVLDPLRLGVALSCS